MNKAWLKDRNAQVILACALALVLIYTVDTSRLAARLTFWENFGETTISPARLVFFTSDTPNVIGYSDAATGERVECVDAVAYVTTSSGESYRCCNTGRRVSCLAGDFTTDIPTTDPNCTTALLSTFGVPASLPGAKDYLVYGVCSESGVSELTMAQLDTDGQVRWKNIASYGPEVAASLLRFVLGPALLLLAIRAFSLMRRKPDPDRQIRRW